MIFLVHLSLKYRHRQFQLHDLQRLVAACTKPVVVAGDFNALWGRREVQLFLSATGLESANLEGAASWPSRAPILELDYIFHSRHIQSRRLTIPQIKLSDHAPLVWDFDILPPHTRSAAYGSAMAPGTVEPAEVVAASP